MKVLLADDHRLLLDGLTSLLEAHGIQVVGAAHDGEEAIALARELDPDVILMDVRMPVCDGLEATRRIAAEMPTAKIVILTTYAEDQILFEAIKSGAYGYLLKSMDAEELVECLDLVCQGIPPFSPGLATKLLSEFARLSVSGSAGPQTGQAETPPEKRVDRLTVRQQQVLGLVAQGFSYKQVGIQLGLSPRTVKYHMAKILEQLHLENRAQVLAYAGRLGMGTPVDH